MTLTRQVELARTTLDEARAASRDTRQDLTQLLTKADAATGQLRLLIAAAPPPQAPAPVPAPQPAVAAPAPQASEPPAPRVEPAPVIAIRPAPVPEPEPEPAPRPAPHLTEVPKPRALAPIENPLRRRDSAEPTLTQSEDDILEALSALAGGR